MYKKKHLANGQALSLINCSSKCSVLSQISHSLPDLSLKLHKYSGFTESLQIMLESFTAPGPMYKQMYMLTVNH